jgi:hypothetical protein
MIYLTRITESPGTLVINKTRDVKILTILPGIRYPVQN